MLILATLLIIRFIILMIPQKYESEHKEWLFTTEYYVILLCLTIMFTFGKW
jgi:hypothetical protein